MIEVESYAEYFGAVFPDEEDVAEGIEYGPTGSEFEGTLISGSAPASPQLQGITAAILNNIGEPLPGSKVIIRLEKPATTNDHIISYAAVTVVANQNGIATFNLIRRNQFTSGGVYRIQAYSPAGDILVFDKRVFSTSTATANLEDLPQAPLW